MVLIIIKRICEYETKLDLEKKKPESKFMNDTRMFTFFFPFSLRSVVTATVLYDSNSVVDISQIQKRLSLNNSTSGISIRDNTDAEVSKST